ncbi:hypothetical protein ACFQPA_10625 [Halomarina halobia]|uniref:Uncharacterized protein n=1 Tax=Halomarina halobia TaxID=3033386 RepID=A0ABD6AB15_9EURY|nr:hypothetical protein [Halomarina sp. PSR21]
MTLAHSSWQFLAVVVATALVTASVATGVPVGTFTLGIDQTRSHTEEPGGLVPEGYSLAFDGDAVTGVTVLVNNTGTELTGDARAKLVAKNGSVLVSGTNSAVLGTAGTQEIHVEFTGTYELSEFSRVQVTVAESL